MDRRGFQPAIEEHIKILFFIDDRSSSTAQSKRRTYYEWKTKALRDFFSFKERSSRFRRSHRDTDFIEQHAEFFAVFSDLYGINIYPDDFYPKVFPDTFLISFNTKVEGCLSAHCRENGIYFGVSF